MYKILGLLFVLLVASPGYGVERWDCYTGYGSSRALAVSLLAWPDKGAGKVYAAGIEQQASYKVQGLSRRWNFGLTEDDDYIYAVIIDLEGDGLYYDFTLSDRAKPKTLMKCSKRN